MKAIKKKMTACVVASMLAIPSLSFAAGNSGSQTVKQVQVNQAGRVLVWGNTGAWNNPDSCDSSNYLVFLPVPGGTVNEYYSEMYALLVSSYLQGKQTNGYLSGCEDVNGTTYPLLRNITSF